MGQKLTELIARHRELSRRLEELVSSLESDSDAETSELDSQLTENLEQILAAQSLIESDLRLRIEFVSELMRVRTAGLVLLDRELQIIQGDYESIIGLYRYKNAADNEHG